MLGSTMSNRLKLIVGSALMFVIITILPYSLIQHRKKATALY